MSEERSISARSGGDSSELLTGKALETPKLKAEREVAALLAPAGLALRRILETELHSVEKGAMAAFAREQREAAMSIIDGCLGMASMPGGRQTRDAKTILAAVGGDAVTQELLKRYATKQRSAEKAERARIVEAVPAQVEPSINGEPVSYEGSERMSRIQPTDVNVSSGEQSPKADVHITHTDAQPKDGEGG